MRQVLAEGIADLRRQRHDFLQYYKNRQIATFDGNSSTSNKCRKPASDTLLPESPARTIGIDTLRRRPSAHCRFRYVRGTGYRRPVSCKHRFPVSGISTAWPHTRAKESQFSEHGRTVRRRPSRRENGPGPGIRIEAPVQGTASRRRVPSGPRLIWPAGPAVARPDPR